MQNVITTVASVKWQGHAQKLQPGITSQPLVLVECYGANGSSVRDTTLAIRYGWEGMGEEETPPLGLLDKPPGEMGGLHIPLWPGQVLWCEVANTPYPSDRVYGLDNSGSYFVEFRLVENT